MSVHCHEMHALSTTHITDLINSNGGGFDSTVSALNLTASLPYECGSMFVSKLLGIYNRQGIHAMVCEECIMNGVSSLGSS